MTFRMRASRASRPALLLALAAAAAAPAAAQPAGDSIPLRFGWPETMRARVEQEWTRVQEDPGRTQSEHVVTRYRLTVAAHAEGRVVRADSFAVVSTGDAADASDAAMRLALARLASLQPSYVVSAAGGFVRLDDVAATKAAIDSLMAPIVAQARSTAPQLVAMMEASTSEEALAAAAQGEWNALVGNWAGSDWVIGRARTHASEEPVRFWPGLTLTTTHVRRAIARVPCAAAETALRCVRLEVRSRPDPEGMKRLVRRLVEELTPGEARRIAGAIASLDSEATLTLVADAATLVPYELTETRRVRVQQRDGARSTAGTRVDTRTKRFVYER